MDVVLYMRYSSDRQTEQSIEGQQRVCMEFCKRQGYNVVGKYVDRATSAFKDTEKRTEFNRMIKDSDKQMWQGVVVYKLDRFARNRYDSATYKARLKKNGIKVISATENISDNPEGVILEAVLEGMAEFYSKELSQKISRGLRESAYKCHSIGGHIPLGYKIVEKKLVIDEPNAQIVREAFDLYANGATVAEICEKFNNQGYRTAKGAKFNKNSFKSMFRNEKYVGVYTYKEIRIEDGVPAIIDKNTFDTVQKRLKKNGEAPSRGKAKVDYILAQKLFCGHCGATMVGDSGTSRTGEVHNYYTCSNRKRFHSCDKKSIRKEVIERIVAEDAFALFTPERIEWIADMAIKGNQEDLENDEVIPALRAEIKELDKGISNLLKLVERGAESDTLATRLTDLEKQKRDAERRLMVAEDDYIILDRDLIIHWLSQFLDGDIEDEEFRRQIIDLLVNSVTVWDEPDGYYKITAVYNLTDERTKSFRIEVEERSDLRSQLPAKAMYRISGFQFYNTSEFDLAGLVNDADHIAANFKSYLQGFSANVLEILMSKERGLNFGEEIDKMDKNNRLLSVIKAFSELDLDPRTIDNVKMGYIFEELIRKFSENAEAGDHYTGRDIIKLMVNILLAEGCDDIFDDGKVINILDQACGTGGMLSTGYNFIKRYNPSADVRLFGQEINPESYAMCLAEMLIKGQNAENICYQDTMKADRFKGTKMRFVLENPPFGTAWGGKDAAEGVEDAVNAEYQKGFDSRWGAGLPGSGDMQMLFLQSAIDKMDDNFGRAAIIENGSPLFSGGTASGESQIRRWMLESDLIEAVIALPTDLFYNTGIATYIWVLSKNKRPERKGKIQLIDASTFFKKLRKALGDKKNEISPEDRSAVTKLYADFTENEYCKIYRNEEFIYREYTVMQPLQRSYAITEERIQAMVSKGALDSLYNEVKFADLELMEERDGKAQKQLNKFFVGKPIYDAILADLNHAISDTVWMSPDAFMLHLTEVLSKATTDKKLLEKIADGLSVMDKNAEIQRDRKGNVIYDKETKDTELVKWEDNIEDYMAREVLPHIPDAAAFFEEDLGKKKPVIKTGAEIPFTRCFYKYQQPTASEELKARFSELELSVSERVAKLF